MKLLNWQSTLWLVLVGLLCGGPAQAQWPGQLQAPADSAPISLNFQNTEVKALMQVFADFTGLNVVASDSVGGSLTLRLKDVPWDQALDIV